MCYIDGQKNKYSVLNECNRMLKYNILDTPIGNTHNQTDNISMGEEIQVYSISNHSGQQIVILATTWWWQKLGRD
jgi:hypothetical protein